MLTPDIFANLKFYPTDKGGREGPTPPNFFGCIIKIGNSNHDARLILEKIGSIFPGDTKNNVPIKFLCSDLVMKKLKISDKFFIRDGGVIGEGEVIMIVNSETQND